MQDVDAGVFQHLRESVKGGFDEEHFAARIGFGNLRRWVLLGRAPGARGGRLPPCWCSWGAAGASHLQQGQPSFASCGRQQSPAKERLAMAAA
jgi:hypothetical protein